MNKLICEVCNKQLEGNEVGTRCEVCDKLICARCWLNHLALEHKQYLTDYRKLRESKKFSFY